MERISYQQFRSQFFWRQGEHITIVGPTGSGKTTLGLDLLSMRAYSVVFATKVKDTSLSSFFSREKYEIISKWPPSAHARRVALWPKARKLKDIVAIQYRAFDSAIDAIYEEGAWTIFLDEAFYVCDDLDMASSVKTIITQGRSNYLSLVSCTQRPRHIPLWLLNQPTHLIYFRFVDKYETDRLSDIAGMEKERIASELKQLGKYEFLYINTVDGTILKSKLER